MADLTAGIQQPGLSGVTPNYQVCSAADTFKAASGARYELHYKNAATPTTILKVTDPTTPIPGGSTAAAGFADLQVSAALGASAERKVIIDANRFRDASGNINLVHGTPTTLTLNIIGPL